MNIDLLDPAAFRDGQPYAQYAWLREHSPVHWHEEPDGPGFWAVTRYHDAKKVLRAPDLFSNSPSSVLNDNASMGDAAHREILFEDAPRHTEHRKFLAPELSAKSVRRISDAIRITVQDIINAVIDDGECDLVPALSGKLASYVIADLLGLPRHDIVMLYEAVDTLINSGDRAVGTAVEAAATLREYANTVWVDKTHTPGTDYTSRLANGAWGDRPVDQTQFVLDLKFLVAAGGDTTRNVFSGGMAELLRNADQTAALRADPGLIPYAVEEMLRWAPPIVYQRRTATSDTNIAGVEIKAGQKVAVYGGAANRDGAIFRAPDEFTIGRTPNPHLSFGFGAHFCLGSHLGRLELRIMLEEVLRRMSHIESAGPAVWTEHGGGNLPPTVHGLKSLPIRFKAAKDRQPA